MTLKEAKQNIRAYLAILPEARLCDLAAAAKDERMVWACGEKCLVGIGEGGTVERYCRVQEEPIQHKANYGYHALARYDDIRCRRLLPMVRAELKKRDHARQVTQVLDLIGAER